MSPLYHQGRDHRAPAQGDRGFHESTYKKYLADPEGYERNTKNTAYINYLKNEFPLRLKWTDEECYQHGLHYYDEDAVRPDGSVFYTYNPNSKWDWYSIGGRFQNLIPLKGGGFTDEASMDDVDIEYHSKEAYKRAIRFWQLVVDEQPPVTEEDEEVVKYAFYKKEYYTERYDSAEDYADFCSGFHVYATLLPNYEWLEPGQMGWFGLSAADADDERKWRKRLKEIFKIAKEKHWDITIVDCHI